MVKFLVHEPDSMHYRKLSEGHDIAICDLAVTEVIGALMMKERTRAVDAATRVRVWNDFNRRVEQEYFTVLPVTATAFRKAEQFILRCHPRVALRAMDALHLAVCDLEQNFPLVTDDEKMRAAAELLGIPVLC